VNDEFPRVEPRGPSATVVDSGIGDDVDVDLDDELTEPAPSVVPKAAVSEPSLAGSGIDAARKPRPRATLRIPDDEVSRPSQAPLEARAGSRPEIAPSRIISINPPPPKEVVAAKRPVASAPAAAPSSPRPSSPAFGPSAPSEPSLEVAAAAPAAPRALESVGGLETPDTALDIIPVTSSEPPPEALQSSDAVELDEAESEAVLASQRPVVLAANEEEMTTDVIRSPLGTVPDGDASDGVDIPVDEEEDLPPSSDAEIAPEDLVSVESMPQADADDKIPSYTPPPVGMQSTPNLAQAAQSPSGSTAVHAAATAAAVSAVSAGEPSGARPQLVIVPPHGSPLAPPPMNESSAAAAARKRARPWWEELFGDDFIRTMAKITDGQIYEECDFIEDSLGVAKGAMVLDLGCGTGRHAIELSRRGYQVVGYDLSLPMLARAADEAQERDQKLNFLQGDMRDMTFDDTFDGIYSWNTSFGFFEEEKNAQVITKVHKALRMGGQFLLDVINRDFLIRQAPSLAWFEGDGCICMDEMQIDWITSRMRVKRTMMMDDGRSKEIEYSIRVYSLHELGKILHDHGFRVAEVSGRTATPGVFFGNESPRTLILAEKR
jgi:SAM-dependent methyltransferase